MLQSVLSFVFIKLIYIPINVRGYSNTIDTVLFALCSILYLLWYYRISANFDMVASENKARVELFYWFLPFANAYLVFKHLRRMYKNYIAQIKLEKLRYRSNLVHTCLSVWLVFFVLFYIFTFKVVSDLPVFPEDEMMFYMKNPGTELFHLLGESILDVVGMSTMIYIVLAIQELETMVKIKDRDAIDHIRGADE